MHLASSVVVASATAGGGSGSGSAIGNVSGGVAPLVNPKKKRARSVPNKFIACVIMVAVVLYYTALDQIFKSD